MKVAVTDICLTVENKESSSFVNFSVVSLGFEEVFRFQEWQTL
jgi:hypothetical protein